LSSGPRIVRGTSKIDAVSGHKGPFSFHDEGFQFPVFPFPDKEVRSRFFVIDP
jgi:hypothetical protein